MDMKVCNPRQLSDLWDEREIGDPFLMRHDGRFYLYCSSRGAAGIKCWVSEDMIRFTYYGFVCEDPRIFGAYAPEVAYNAGKFWMVTSPVGSGHYLLRADSPLGPYEIVSDNLGIGIDGSLFVDDDGRSWFYRASHQGIRVHEMPHPDEIDVRSKPISASYLGHWTEGPQVIKRDGRYFLTDTGNHVLSRGYHVDYCVSHEGPDRGYRRTRDSILLLETRDEYHALGHSSTCVGPDMDTMYIIYHKNILDERNRPLFRSMNIDRLHFNGDRMYCNATWWEQPAPIQPICVSREGNGLIAHMYGYALPVSAGEIYTAELNLWLQDEVGSVFFSADGRHRGQLILHGDRHWQCIADDNSCEGILPANVDMKSLLTVKVSMNKGQLVLYINGMEILRQKTELRGGAIGMDNGCKPSFVGLSDVAQGSQDGAVAKSVPGAFDAIHQMEMVGQTAQGEHGCTALLLRKGETAKYLVNVWKTREYHLSLTMCAKSEDVRLCVNGLYLVCATIFM